MKHIIGVLVENKFGVLAHVSGLFSARGFNIESLAVGETEDATMSRMTIVVAGDERILEQVKKQLNKLIDVIKVLDLTKSKYIARELALIKVGVTNKTKKQVIQAVDSMKGKISYASDQLVVVEISDDKETIDSLIELLKPFGIKEISRTGKIALGLE